MGQSCCSAGSLRAEAGLDVGLCDAQRNDDDVAVRAVDDLLDLLPWEELISNDLCHPWQQMVWLWKKACSSSRPYY